MGILGNIDQTIRESDMASARITELETYYAGLLQYGVRSLYGYKKFKDELESLLPWACQDLKEHKNRLIASLDCSGLAKGDADGFVAAVLKDAPNRPIVVLENIDAIPDGDRSIYDDPRYVKDILLNSWEGKTITVLVVKND